MFTTDRLRINQFSLHDLDGLADLFSSECAMRFVGPRRAISEAGVPHHKEYQHFQAYALQVKG